MRSDESVAVSPSFVQVGVMFAKKDVRRDFLSDLGPAMIASESNAHFDFPLSTSPVRRAPSNSSFRFPVVSDVFLDIRRIFRRAAAPPLRRLRSKNSTSRFLRTSSPTFGRSPRSDARTAGDANKSV
jgi:hypothetical protein